MNALLDRNPRVDAVFAQNDDMGLGAVTAIRNWGLEPGRDVKLATVDATRAGLTALAAGTLNYVVECSPIIGSQLMDLVVDVYLGAYVPKRVLSEKLVFDQVSAKEELPRREY
jgi:simple sugar transport system substrate-binding protein